LPEAVLPIAANTPERAPPPLWWGPALLLLGGVCIGFAPIGLKLSDMGPQSTALWRYLFSLPLLFAIALMVRRGRPPERPPAAAIVAGVCFGLDIGLWHAGLTLTTVANATFIVNLGNIGVGLAAWLVLKEKPTLIWAGAALVAMTGAGFLSLGGQAAAGEGDLRGDALAFGAALLVSFYMVYAKQARQRMDAFSVLFWMTVTEAVVAATLTAITGEAFLPGTVAGFTWPFILAIVAQVAGQGLIILGLGMTPTAIAGILVLIQPVTAAIAARFLFDQSLVPLQMFGAGLILVGIALSQRKRRPRPVV
jgi:drug/metabolite transporter (DMT)-like permease